MEEDNSNIAPVEQFNITKALRVLVPALPQSGQFLGHSSFPVKVGIQRMFQLTIYFYDQKLPKQQYKVVYIVNYQKAMLQKVLQKSNISGAVLVGFNQLVAGTREYLRF